MAHDPYALSDEDRLPWLEPVDDVDAREPVAPLRWLVPLLGLLVLAAIVVGLVYWWQNRDVTPSGTGELIAAPKEPYRVRPAEEGGMKVEGQGDVVFQTSQGAQVQGSLDLNAVPETPVTRAPVPKPAPTPTASPRASAVILENTGGTLVARSVPAAAPEGTPGATLQLGAFPSEGAAKKAWDSMSKRFAYLAELGQSVMKAEVNGRTYYRLRVNAGSPAQAKDVCARLRVAGENCLVVN